MFLKILNLLTIDNFIYSAIAALMVFSYLEWRKIKNLASAQMATAEPRMLEIAGMIKEGSMAYLFRQLKVLLIVESVIAVLLVIFTNVHVAVAFGIGAFFSWLCGFTAMYVSVSANYKVTLLAKVGLKDAFNGAFSVGRMVGYLVSGVALSVIFGAYKYASCFESSVLVQVLIGLSFGSSLISIFARIGGGIFTKGADIGADLVGKIEKNIPEDDPRNPAVIADNVGDNVGDCAGMAADLFESFIVIVSSAIALASFCFGANALPYIMVVFTLLASGAWASVLTLQSGWQYSSTAKFASLKIALKTMIFSALIFVNAFGLFFWGLDNLYSLSICALIGLFSAAFVMPLTEYYTGTKFGPVRRIAQASKNGHATNVIQGIAVGLEACFIPFVIIGGSILACVSLAGIFGVAIACVEMISVCAVILALDAFGPVTDNAGGLAEMGELDKSVRVITDELDAIGNITKATTKGYAVYSAALATIVLASTFKMDLVAAFSSENWSMNIDSGSVVAGFFVGSAVVALFSAICLVGVNKASAAIIEEVRNQFEQMPGIMLGTQRPLYARAIDILTKASLKQMIVPSLIPLVGTILFFEINYALFGKVAAFTSLGGYIFGVTIVGIFIACSMTVSGGAWDNAKKHIEATGSKGSPEHQAAVTGDTVGDPYKDTTGPSINPMIKLVGIVALLLIMMHK